MFPYTEDTARSALSNTNSFGGATDNASDLEEDNLSSLPTTALFHSALQENCPTAVRLGPKSPALQFPENKYIDLPNTHISTAASTASTSSTRFSRTPRATPTPSPTAGATTPPVRFGSAAPPVRFGSAAPSVRFGSAATTAPTLTGSPPQPTATTLAAAATVPSFHPVSDSAVTHEDDAGSCSDDQEEFEKVHLEIKREEIRNLLTSGSVSKNLYDRLEVFTAKPVTLNMCGNPPANNV